MEQREGAGEAAPMMRQLDFAANFTAAAANANVKGNSQPKWLEEANSQHASAVLGPQSAPRQLARTKFPPRKMVMPPKSPHRELPQMAEQPQSPPVAPVHAPKLALQPLLKMESPKSREHNPEQNGGTPKKQKQCRCKNSRCLKLYCECFANGVYCDGCNCVNCYNTKEKEADRKEAIGAVLERKPDAFYGAEQSRGCNCKRTGCLKKYCECFQANIPCSDKCKCVDCKNFEGCEERKARLYHHSADSVAFIQQANAAINGAIGPPSKKKVAFDETSRGKITKWLPESHQEPCFSPGTSYLPSFVQPSKPDPTNLGFSKSLYRSPLSGILRLQHVNDFCKHLVEVSTEAAKTLPEERKMINGGIDVNRAATLCGHYEDSNDHQNQQNAVEFPENTGNRDRASLRESDGYDIQNGRPLSPGTLALMCDERDAAFMADNAPSTVAESDTRTNSESASALGPDQLYVEQERLVLTKLRCFLNGLITCGSIEETRKKPEVP
ncbi:protein tesmin/TSO1-like CXC 5 isoform X1 [Salvia splendens]|uniref:protein tesmin/TSO1-like CXC 5 isoform X1 n=1 Tax=Salvia splendens TaxID=180675 RepID=UPI001C27C5A1|nr:protein tesmin/TSO1-like CXC 5 isoform X1 [Salvia splendens]XP_042004428.1 protein tesmin/TSO1-like CXC 5 isoform X1 [Salvia splendens]